MSNEEEGEGQENGLIDDKKELGIFQEGMCSKAVRV